MVIGSGQALVACGLATPTHTTQNNTSATPQASVKLMDLQTRIVHVRVSEMIHQRNVLWVQGTSALQGFNADTLFMEGIG